ncbi:MAG: ATP-binding protein [Acidobacteriota bacterium]
MLKKFTRSDWARIGVLLLGIGLVTAGHYLTPPSLFLWHNIFQRLYYLPIVFAAISFGWPGGLAAAACSGLCYIPHILMVWHAMPDYSANQYAEIVVFFLVGLVTGVLASREKKRAEELQRTADQLSKVYRELQDSFEQLKRADRLSAIGQLSAGLAHEIRNPLASIEGAIDILERDPGSEEKRQEFFGIMKKECRRLKRLLSDLLDFARPRPPRIQPVGITRIVESVVSLAGPVAERCGITIRPAIPADLPDIECDAEQLQQVILNLALNAIQAMPEGGCVTLAAHKQDSQIVVLVKDEGCGIPSEDLDKIFDPFYTTKENGTGLGLSVAHQIVKQHGGAITVEANPDKGMTFAVVLPVRYGGKR